MKNILYYLILFVCLLDEALLAVKTYSCPIHALKNGKVRKRQRGRFVKFVCNSGYMLSGERYSTCIHGRWDPSPPKCVRPTCMNRVQPPLNGLIYPSHNGAALHFFCKTGYQLKGPTDIYCDGQKWDNNAPICLSANTKPKYFCDFEEEDICGWTHDLNHDFDWRRENYETPSGSIGTGPSFDHTKGAGQDGYYMYIESSSRNENDTARLISPIFDKRNTETCLEFFYHMFGATTGSLRVYLKRASDSWNLNPRYAIFSKRGNQGDKWYRSYHSLGVINEDFQIVIEGVRGPGYVSDTAVDDVKIVPDCVQEEEGYSTTSEEPYSTEAFLTVESCENRCGQKGAANDSSQITCDCDDTCYDNNKCCPDYLDFCVMGSTADIYTTTDIPNEINLPQSKTTTKKYLHKVQLTTEKPIYTSVLPHILRYIPTTGAYSTPPTTMKKTVRITSSERILTTKRTPIRAKKPTVYVMPPPITPKIIRKLLPSVGPKAINPKIVYVKPKPIKPVKQINLNDIMEMPKEKNTPPDDDDNSIFSKENWSEEVANHIDSPFTRNFSTNHKLLSEKSPDEQSYSTIIIAISVTGIVVCSLVGSFVLVRRYRHSRRRMNYSNGDSQSDVRFLTGDEVLDFSLDKDYDDM